MPIYGSQATQRTWLSTYRIKGGILSRLFVGHKDMWELHVICDNDVT